MTSLGNNTKYEYLYGTNVIRSLLNVNAGNRKIKRILVSEGVYNRKKIADLLSIADKRGILVSRQSPDSLKEMSDDLLEGKRLSGSQSIIAEVTPYNYSDLLHSLTKKVTGKEVFLMLDGVTDIGNFSSILRNCSAFGASGVIISKHRSASVNNRVSKISSGALEEVKIFMVKNLVKTITILKDYGFWIYGSTLAKDISKDIGDTEFTFPMVLVLGNEEKGISRLVQKNCDVLVKIPQRGSMQSLNVSVATGIFLYNIQEISPRKR